TYIQDLVSRAYQRRDKLPRRVLWSRNSIMHQGCQYMVRQISPIFTSLGGLDIQQRRQDAAAQKQLGLPCWWRTAIIHVHHKRPKTRRALRNKRFAIASHGGCKISEN